MTSNPEITLKTCFVGLVGDDQHGRKLKAFIESITTESEIIIQKGVSTLTVSDTTQSPNYFCSSLLLEGRLFEITNKYNYIYLPCALLSAFEGIEVFLQLGYYLSDRIVVHGENMCICMSLSSDLIRNHEDQLAAVLPFIDFLFGTEDDARAFAEVRFGEDRSTRDVASYIASIGKVANLRPRVVIFTAGLSNPTIVATIGKIFAVPVMSDNFHQFKGSSTTLTFNMDAFAGGFISSLVSIESQFEHIVLLCGPRAKTSKTTLSALTSEGKQSVQSLVVHREKEIGTRKKTRESSVIDPRKVYTKQEIRDFYDSVICPKKKIVQAAPLMEEGTSNLSESSICAGVKSITECVSGGHYAAMSASAVFSLNAMRSFYGAQHSVR